MKHSVGLAMIVRNEEANLVRCLDSVKDTVDEIVIVDTGSTDRTLEIARRYTAKVYQYPWDGDFSAARNYAIAQCSSRWILSLDADEELDTTSGDLRELVASSGEYEAFFLPIYNQTDEFPDAYTRFLVLRLFRNTPAYRFKGRIHEQVVINRPEVVGIAGTPVIVHRLVSVKERNRKRNRNLALLRQAAAEDPANPFLQYYLGVEWLGLGKVKQALPYFQQAAEQLTDGHILFRAPAVRYLIHCLKTLGKPDEAICVCMEESSRYPFYTDLFFDGGVLFEQKGEYEVAIKWFQEALKCGSPPPMFSHTNGTESFLSLYHLGYCCEKLGQQRQARHYYEQAFASNPDYVYPLYNLFLTYLTETGPLGTFDYLKAAGYLSHPQGIKVLGILFFEAGFPDLACACFQAPVSPAGDPTSDCAHIFARSLTYGGRPGEAIPFINSIRRTSGEIDLDLAVDEVIALILSNDYDTARARALSLWHKPEERSTAWALLNLISLSSNDRWCGKPEKTREPVVIQTTLTIIEKCLRYRPQHPNTASHANDRYSKLITKAIKFLTELSPRGCLALSSYLQEKANAVWQMMDRKYRPAGRLCR
ncbi:MAG: glycosyltransferase [Peptococcaceae bacterium]|nr:glycosyltransferase [Peptococcaceae bacterium]